MRLLIACLLLAITGSLSGVAVVNAADAPRVFMFVRDGSRDLELMLTKEVGVMRAMLEAAGYEVDVATADGRSLSTAMTTLTPTVALAEVDIFDYAGVVLPCMAPAPGNPVPPEVDSIMEQAVSLGLPIAASRGSVATLARAGGIADRRYAFARSVDVEERPEFSGGDYRGIGVVRDGNISTAGICPLASRELGEADGTVELMRAFIESLAERS